MVNNKFWPVWTKLMIDSDNQGSYNQRSLYTVTTSSSSGLATISHEFLRISFKPSQADDVRKAVHKINLCVDNVHPFPIFRTHSQLDSPNPQTVAVNLTKRICHCFNANQKYTVCTVLYLLASIFWIIQIESIPTNKLGMSELIV